MNLRDFHEQRRRRVELDEKPRGLCTTCFQSTVACYCEQVKRFDPQIRFVILIHPIEMRRRIATGRMSHLCLEGSHLILGQNYSCNKRVNDLLGDPDRDAVILYPGANSLNLTNCTADEKATHLPSGRGNGRGLTIFVIDGTWATARKMMKQSLNLQRLPQICFSPTRPSTFRVRKQPAQECVSTIEAIHETLELIGRDYGFGTQDREHDGLLRVFDHMVEKQLEFSDRFKNSRQFATKLSKQKNA